MQYLHLTAIVVRDYDEAIRYYVDVLGFELREDRDMGNGKRFVRVHPQGASQGHAGLLLAKAVNEAQDSRIGNQAGGRVFMFLYTDDFARDHESYRARGVKFIEQPRFEPYGTVVVFEDLYGNRWDLVQPKADESELERSDLDV